MSAPLLEVDNLTVSFGSGRRHTEVLRGVSLTIAPGRMHGIVGESGSGKSTLARTILGMVKADSGRISIDGKDVVGGRARRGAASRESVQLIPQNPYASLDPRRTIGQALAEALEPVRASPTANSDAIAELLKCVLIDPAAASRFPHEFSGGQRQRIAIARALAVRPKLVIADEMTSALDLSVQAEMLSLVARLRAESPTAWLFISHNLAVVHESCDEVSVLYRGQIVEYGEVDSVYRAPAADYTRQLLESVPGGPSFDLG